MANDTPPQGCAAGPAHCPHVAEAADAAVKRVFALLGVDVDVPKEVVQFQENLRFGATMRRAADKGLMAAIGAIAVATMAAIGAGVVSFIWKGH